MHDLSVAREIVEAVKGYEGLRSVFVLVGRDSCLRPEHLVRSFDAAKPGTNAENAVLVVLPGPGDGVCVLSVEVERQ